MQKKPLENISTEALQSELYRRKRQVRQERLERMRKEGRHVSLPHLAPPATEPPPLPRPAVRPTGAWEAYTAQAQEEPSAPEQKPVGKGAWVRDKLLLLVEIAAFVGFVYLVFNIWGTNRELNAELTAVQAQQVAEVALPTPTATPVIGLAILPSGHKPPVDGRPPEQGEAGFIPEHLLPAINAYIPPPQPTRAPAQPRQIQISSIGVDKPIVQGDDWEQLKKGVGHHIGSALPGNSGNMVLSAHNDIYGEIFRDLDELSTGDEIVVNSDLTSYRYVVRDIQIVDPTDVWVMEPTAHASITLISCYPYRINTHRIVVFADLATEG